MTIEMYQDVMNHLQIDKYRELIIEQDHKITELEKACEETQELLDKQIEATYKLDKENAELRKIAEFQQSNNMNTHLENKKLKEGLAVGSTWNKHLNSLNKELEEERDKYRNMVFDKDEQLTKAKKIIRECIKHTCDTFCEVSTCEHCLFKLKVKDKAEQFLNSEEK